MPSSSRLSTAQRDAVEAFQAVTATTDDDSAVAVLETVGWDVQAAIARIYDGGGGPGAGTSRRDDDEEAAEDDTGGQVDDDVRRPLMDTFGIDDSAVVMPPAGGSGSGRRQFGAGAGAGVGAGAGGPAYWIRQLIALPLNLLAWPAGLLLGFIARLLRIRPSGMTAGLRPRNPFSDPSRRLQSPASEAEKWIRSVEEYTGAVRWSRRFDALPGGAGSSSGVEAGGASGLERRAAASGSRATAGGGGAAAARAVLPDFFVGGYEAAVREAKGDIKVLMVVLTCDEHESDGEFKRNVLTDPELVQTLTNEGVLVWGGDVRERDAYSAGRVLQFYTLPFIAFISLQPPSNSSLSSSTTPRMTVISRLEGSPSTVTSAASIASHLTTVVIPRVSPFLNRQRAQQATRLAERRLREEQDRAYAAAARKDEERVLRVRAEAARQAQLERERRETDERTARLRDGAKRWRAWMRRVLEDDPSAREPPDGAEGVARIGVRLGDGRRAVRRFGPQDTVERVYAFVECALEEDDGERSASPPSDYQHVFAFGLATTFPRQMLDVDGEAGSRTIAQVGWLAPNTSLVVEGLEKRRMSFGESTASDDDDEEEVEIEEEEEEG